MKTNILLTLQLLLYCSYGLSQASLTVNDPRNWGWWSEQGTIEEASVVLSPEGIYTNVDLYLTFSARETYFGNEWDTLEITLNFNLPDKAIIHDSWLWVEDQIISAILIDRWTASQIYEGIVNRRQDPSILYKQDDGTYQLRIFPMAGTDTRRVRISYLIPTDWDADHVLTALPTELLSTSLNPLSNLQVLAKLTDDWIEPSMAGLEEYPFEMVNHQELGPLWQTNLPFSQLDMGLNFSVKSPMQDGIYVNKYEDETNQIYQMAFLPNEVFDFSHVNKKVAFLFDYDAANTSDFNQQQFIQTIKNYIASELGDQDYFNLIFSDIGPGLISEEWLPADEANLESVFADLGTTPMPNNPNIWPLINNGIDFIQQNGEEGSLVLIANSDGTGPPDNANLVLDDIMERMGEGIIPIHILDFQNTNFAIHPVENQDFWGNEYFYSNLSRLTSGHYDCTNCQLHLSSKLANVFSNLSAIYGNLDIHTTLENGFCFNRYNLNQQGELIDLSKPFLQVGRYAGEFPFKLQAAGLVQGNLFTEEIVVATDLIQDADTLAVEAWSGNYINELESDFASNQVVAEIIERSMSERVLSLYTAFLCLEPSLGGEPCAECIDQTDFDEPIVSVEDELLEQGILEIRTSANPFKDHLSIYLTFADADADAAQTFRFNIYNAIGQLVHTFRPQQLIAGNELVLEWDGEGLNGQKIPTGVYYFVAENAREKHPVKLVKL